MHVFSFSRLNMYTNCPRRFYYKYVLNLTESVTVPLLLGKACHKAIELMVHGASKREAMVAGLAEIDFEAIPFKDYDYLMSNVPSIRAGETEKYFCLPLSADGSVQIQGYIDWTNGNKLMDWKTNRKIYAVQDNPQLALYSWAISQLTGHTTILASLYFLRFRREISFQYSMADMEQARRWAEQLAKQIQQVVAQLNGTQQDVALFPSCPNKLCEYCSFATNCYRDNQEMRKVQ